MIVERLNPLAASKPDWATMLEDDIVGEELPRSVGVDVVIVLHLHLGVVVGREEKEKELSRFPNGYKWRERFRCEAERKSREHRKWERERKTRIRSTATLSAALHGRDGEGQR